MATPTTNALTPSAGEGISGDPATLYDAAHHITGAARRLRQTAETITAHSRKVTAHWSGTASEAARDHIDRLATRVHTGADVLTALAPVIETYAYALAHAQQAWAEAADRHTSATAALTAAQQAQQAQQAATAGTQVTTTATGTQALQQADTAAQNASAALTAAAEDMAAAVDAATRANTDAAIKVRALIEELAAMGGTPGSPGTPGTTGPTGSTVTTTAPAAHPTGRTTGQDQHDHHNQHGWLYDAVGGFGDGAWGIGPGLIGDLLGLIPTTATHQAAHDIQSAHDDLQDAYGADTTSGAYVGTSVGVQVASLAIPGTGEVKAAAVLSDLARAQRVASFFDGVRAFTAGLPSARTAMAAIRDGISTAAEEHRASALSRGLVLYSGVPAEEVAAAGRFVKTATTRTARNLKYSRPSGYRKGLRDTVWKNAEDEQGIVKDPLTQVEMTKTEPWHMGHRPGYEFRKHAASAEARGISRMQFLEEHNTPEHFQPELPSSNISHESVLGDGIYYGP